VITKGRGVVPQSHQWPADNSFIRSLPNLTVSYRMTVSKVVANVRMLVPGARYDRSGVGCLTFFVEADAYLEQNVFTKQKLGADFVISIPCDRNHKTKHAARFVKPGYPSLLHKICNTFCKPPRSNTYVMADSYLGGTR
jgi:hypothetical protein